MKTLVRLLVLAFAFQITAEAQNTRLDQLYSGYEPTVFNSHSEIETIFNGMPLGFRMPSWRNLKHGSECYQRAEIWTYNFYRNYHYNAMKVFVFYTAAFKSAYYRMRGKEFDWWFHVAPYLLVKNAQGDL